MGILTYIGVGGGGAKALSGFEISDLGLFFVGLFWVINSGFVSSRVLFHTFPCYWVEKYCSSYRSLCYRGVR